MAAEQMIRRANGRKALAVYVRHVRTLTAFSGRDNDDVDLYRVITTGELVECISPASDCRVMPRECKPQGYPGRHPGE